MCWTDLGSCHLLATYTQPCNSNRLTTKEAMQHKRWQPFGDALICRQAMFIKPFWCGYFLYHVCINLFLHFRLFSSHPPGPLSFLSPSWVLAHIELVWLGSSCHRHIAQQLQILGWKTPARAESFSSDIKKMREYVSIRNFKIVKCVKGPCSPAHRLFFCLS